MAPRTQKELRARKSRKGPIITGRNRNGKHSFVDPAPNLLGEEGQEYMVLRTMYLTPALDNTLKAIAARQGKSKNQLLREMLVVGVQKVQKKSLALS
jgi:hypothetical protein